MLFNSFEFLLLFLPVFALYWAIPHSLRKYLIILTSLVFYGFWNQLFLLHFLGVVLLNFLLVRLFEQSRRPWVFYTTIGLNLINLGFFKYFYFALEILAGLVAPGFLAQITPGPDGWIQSIVLPLGISFYTFQLIAFHTEVYRRTVPEKVPFVDFFAFTLFFPVLTAGPILRPGQFLPFLNRPKRINEIGIDRAAWLFASGILKKVILADSLARVINPVFADPSAWNGVSNLIAAYGFTLQIYLDFSGYSDMARGVGRALGFPMPMNFRAPYFSASFTEIWHRWHISLSTWLRDYLYIPLGGSRVPKWRSWINTTLTMVLGGLWHGANFTFIVWGLLSGLYLVMERITGWNRVAATGWRLFGRRLLVYQGWVLGAIFFRSDTMAKAFEMIQGIVKVQGQALPFTSYLGLMLVLPFVLQYFEYSPARLRPLLRRRKILLPVAVIILCFLVTTLTTTSQPFLYFQF